MSQNSLDSALRGILNTAFDASYLVLLEEDRVSLDDELQGRLREVIVTEVYGVLCHECEQRGMMGEALQLHFSEHAQTEIERRLRQELEQEEAGPVPTDLMGRMVLSPAFETAD